MSADSRFSTLDGLRGFAAIAVMFYHLHQSAPLAMPGGYLAVDFFFALSGFVIALAYEDRLLKGMRFGEFAVLRLIRVYPMFFIGTLVGIAINGGSLLAIAPIPALNSPAALFPSNGPMWSLFFELVVNFAFAACVARLNGPSLAAVLAASGLLLARSVVAAGNADLGAFWFNAAPGLARTVFSFSLGVAICRLRRQSGLGRRETWLAWLLPAVLIAAFAYPAPNHVLRDLFCIFALLPALLWLGTKWQAPGGRVLGLLGDLSYPLYCIHAPIVHYFTGSWLAVATSCLGLLGVATWLDRRIDRPVRAWLGRKFRERRPGPSPA